MFCGKCGSDVPGGYAFCTKCGGAISLTAPSAEPEKGASKVSRSRTILLVLCLIFVTWVGSASIAYGVVELTGGGPQGEQGPSGDRGPKGSAGASGSSIDSSTCHRDLMDLILIVNNKFTGQISGAVLEQEVRDVVARLNSSC